MALVMAIDVTAAAATIVNVMAAGTLVADYSGS